MHNLLDDEEVEDIDEVDDLADADAEIEDDEDY